MSSGTPRDKKRGKLMEDELLSGENDDIAADRKRGAKFYIKKTLKYIFYALIAVVWISVLLVIILRRDNPLVNTPVLSGSARAAFEADPEGFEFYRVYPKEFMSEEGAFQLKECVYAPVPGEYEIGLRIAWTQLRYCKECGRLYTPDQLEQQKKYDEEDDKRSCVALGHELVRASGTDRAVKFRVFDSKGNEYENVNCVTRTKDVNFGIIAIKYEYLRISYGGLYFELGDNIINRESSVSRAGSDETVTQGGASETESSGTRYFLEIYDAETDDRLFVTCIYDNDTAIDDEEYEIPDKDYLS